MLLGSVDHDDAREELYAYWKKKLVDCRLRKR
jgi:hypothetical protein